MLDDGTLTHNQIDRILGAAWFVKDGEIVAAVEEERFTRNKYDPRFSVNVYDEPLHWQCLSKRENSSLLLQLDNPRYRWILDIWQRLPLVIANALGSLIRRQITN